MKQVWSWIDSRLPWPLAWPRGGLSAPASARPGPRARGDAASGARTRAESRSLGEALGCVTTGRSRTASRFQLDGDTPYVERGPQRDRDRHGRENGRSPSRGWTATEPGRPHAVGRRAWVLSNADSTISWSGRGRFHRQDDPAAGRPTRIAMNPARGYGDRHVGGRRHADLSILRNVERVSRVTVLGFDGRRRWTRRARRLSLRPLAQRSPAGRSGGRGPRERIARGAAVAAEGKDAHGVALTPIGRTLLLTTQMTGEMMLIDPATPPRRDGCRGGNPLGRRH